MGNLYVLVGVPACGKSTWAKENASENMVWISRDEIRKEIVDLDHVDVSLYFSKETLVYDTYVVRICQALKAGKDVIADATHINTSSRAKLMRMIRSRGIHPEQLIAVMFPVDKDIALERNAKRKGWRRVPDRAIHEMNEKFWQDAGRLPNEGFDMVIDGVKGDVIYVR